MSAKSILIILITVLLTVILMNNNDEMGFWLFGEVKIPKLAVLGGMFFLGWIIGYLMGKPRLVKSTNLEEKEQPDHGLTEKDRDYIR